MMVTNNCSLQFTNSYTHELAMFSLFCQNLIVNHLLLQVQIYHVDEHDDYPWHIYHCSLEKPSHRFHIPKTNIQFTSVVIMSSGKQCYKVSRKLLPLM